MTQSWRETMKTPIDSYIYYIDDEGNHWPGRVKAQMRTVVLVAINHADGDILRWVPRGSVELQEVNDEKG